MAEEKQFKRNAWLELFRLPNLLTVPGDPLAGFLLAAAAISPVPLLSLVWLPMLASLCLYITGLISNDLADLKEDSRDRPERPLPSGRIHRSSAVAALVFFTLAGLGLAFLSNQKVFVIACLLACTILLYNFSFKTFPVLGPLAMGFCRGTSFAMGAAAASPNVSGNVPVLIAFTGLVLYIACLTLISRRETIRRTIGFIRWLPALSLLAMFIGLFYIFPIVSIRTVVVASIAYFWAIYQGFRLAGIPKIPVVQSSIANLISNLLVVQSSLSFLSGSTAGIVAGIALLLLWTISFYTATKFYMT